MGFSILPLIVPVLSSEEIQTFTKLIDCFFDENAEIEDTPTNDNSTIYTVEDLIKKVNKNGGTKMDIDLNDVGETKSDYGLWSIVEGVLNNLNIPMHIRI